VSRLGIEPRTLGLKGQIGPSEVLARIHKRWSLLDKSRAAITADLKLWQELASRLLTAREVAAHLRVSTRTVYTLCEEGKLLHVRIANAIRIEPAALAAFVRSRTE
jgi:excisionase family DNA binding protein